MEALILLFIVVMAFSVLGWTASASSKSKEQERAPRQEKRQQCCKNEEYPQEGKGVDIHPEVRVERVIDGDTVVVIHQRRKVKVRLDAIDCPEDGQEWGDIAKYGLIKLIGGKRVRIEIHTTDRYQRTVATLYVYNRETAQWVNVNERMVTLGHAWVMRRFYQHLSPERQKKLNQLENWARRKKIGLWRAPDPIAPWRWRSEHTNRLRA